MTKDEQARSFHEQALVILEEARFLKERQSWHLVVRRCQEAVELALKSALLHAGLEAPRMHDVGPMLRQHAERFPEPFRGSIPHLASISRSLRAERELAFYGDEQIGAGPSELYGPEDGERALAQAQEVLEAARALLLENNESSKG